MADLLTDVRSYILNLKTFDPPVEGEMLTPGEVARRAGWSFSNWQRNRSDVPMRDLLALYPGRSYEDWVALIDNTPSGVDDEVNGYLCRLRYTILHLL